MTLSQVQAPSFGGDQSKKPGEGSDEVPEVLLLQEHLGEVLLIVRRQKAENEVMHGRLAHSESELQFMREEVLKLTANVAFLREEAAGLHQEIGRHKEHRETQVGQIREKHGEWERTVNELKFHKELEKSELGAKNEQLKTKLESEKARSGHIERERDQALQREQDATVKIREMEEASTLALEREREYVTQRQFLEDENRVHKKQLEEIRKELQRVMSEKAEIEQQKNTMEHEREILKSQISR